MQRIAHLLGTQNTSLLRALEAMNATIDAHAHDVQLLGDIAQKSALLKRTLRLDPLDTTSYELYVGLRQMVVKDNERVARAVGIQHPNAVSEATPLIIKALHAVYAEQTVYVPKQTVIKGLIKKNSPSTVMKLLHYRSIDSMLKHESPSRIVTLARYLESNDWNKRHHGLLTSLTPQDFELRPIEIVWLDKAVLVEALAPTRTRHHLVLHGKEVGCVAIAPTAEKVINGYTIRTLSLMIHYIQEVQYISTYAKTMATDSSFGAMYAEAIVHANDSHFELSGHPAHWRALHNAVHQAEIGDVFPPHIQEKEWQTQQANDQLHTFNDLVTFWHGNGYVITGDDQPVSANIIDLAIDESYGRAHGQQSLKFGRRELEQELLSRYLGEPRIHTVVLKRYNII